MRWEVIILIFYGGLAVGSCNQDSKSSKSEELTIVVEADRSKIAEEERKLKQQEAMFDKEREQLRREKEELMTAKEQVKDKDQEQTKRVSELEKKLWQKERDMWSREDILTKEREKLTKQKDEVIDKVGSRNLGGDSTVNRERSVAQREKSLADREAELARREKELADRESLFARREADFIRLQGSLATVHIPVAVKSDESRQAQNPQKIEKAYLAIVEQMRKKGILVDDLPAESMNLQKEINAAKKESEFGKMQNLVEQLRAVVNAIRVDGPFIDRKFERLAQLTKERPPQGNDKGKISTLQRTAVQLYSDGKFVLANKELNKIFALLLR